MSQAVMPFFDSSDEATAYAINASGKSYKQVGAALFPEKSVDAAATALRNALNPNRDEKLTGDQHVFIANFTGVHAYVQYVCMKTSHAQPIRVTPEQQAENARQETIELLRTLKGVVSRAESLGLLAN